MNDDTNTTQGETDGRDPLIMRLKVLGSHDIAATGPLLELVEELLQDSRRQYDATAARVLMRTRESLVKRLEEAVSTDKWISVGTAASRTRRPAGTIRYWCRMEKIKARRVGGRRWEVDSQSLYRHDETT